MEFDQLERRLKRCRDAEEKDRLLLYMAKICVEAKMLIQPGRVSPARHPNLSDMAQFLSM